MNCSRSNTHTIFLALYFSLVVQFSMTVCRYLRSDFDIIPQSFPLVNTFFKSFFTFFDIFSRLLDVMAPEWATFDIIARYFALVKYNFCVFYPFYTFLAFCPKYIRQNGRLFCRKSKKPSATVIKARKRAGFLPYYIYACARRIKLFITPRFLSRQIHNCVL